MNGSDVTSNSPDECEFSFRFPVEDENAHSEKPAAHPEMPTPFLPASGERLRPVRYKQRCSSAPEVSTAASLISSTSSTSDTAIESPLPVADQDAALGAQKAKLNFQRSNEVRTVIQTTHGVFDLMKKDVLKTDADNGWIYILRSAVHPGLVKIGRTTQAISDRQRQIKRCAGRGLEAIDVDDYFRVSNHTRVEKLIRAELWNHERKFPCDACNSTTRMHGEWFEISEVKASEVVRRWKRWMYTDPYSDGQLRPHEVLRIDQYAGDSRVMESMISENGQTWRWEEFMSTPKSYFRYLWLHQFLFAKRQTGKSDRSRWESLFAHWKSNLAFFLFSYAVSVSLSSLSFCFPFLMRLTTGANIIVLGIGAILYAA